MFIHVYVAYVTFLYLYNYTHFRDFSIGASICSKASLNESVFEFDYRFTGCYKRMVSSDSLEHARYTP